MGRSGIDRSEYPIQLRRAIAEHLPARGLALMGRCRWSDRLLAMVMLLAVFSERSTWRDRFSQARSAAVGMYASRRRPGRSFAGFIARMARHSERLAALLACGFRRRMRDQFQGRWRVGRWLAFCVDGTKIDCPRTLANESAFKIGGRKGSGPQMLLVSLMHLGTGMLWSWRKDHARGSERGLLLSMLGDLPERSLLIADAGFVGCDVLTTLVGAGHWVLMRAGANVTLLQKLGYQVREQGDIVYLWPKRAGEKKLEPLVRRQACGTCEPSRQYVAGTLRIIREAMSGRGKPKGSLTRQMSLLQTDDYVRSSSKRARDWPHKKNDPHCKVPELRMASDAEVQLAKELRSLEIAA